MVEVTAEVVLEQLILDDWELYHDQNKKTAGAEDNNSVVRRGEEKRRNDVFRWQNRLEISEGRNKHSTAAVLHVYG